MKYFIDTEFNERPNFLELISIGIVCEDDTSLYRINKDFKLSNCNNWVKENVLPNLFIDGTTGYSLLKIKDDILQFIGDDKEPEFWGYFCDYDWVLLCWLFGTMMDLPEHFPKYCLDLKQEMKRLGIKRNQLPRCGTHNALDDARWIKKIYYLIEKDS